MSEFSERAIGGNDDQAFTEMRKLAACGLVLSDGMSADEAAAQADKSIFQKGVEYAVGRGEMAADAAIDSLIDRQACGLSVIIHKTIENAVNVGCRVAGGWLGHFFGPQGIIVGQKIGATVAGILNANLSTIIDKGIEKVKDVARTVYQKGKEMLKSVGSKIKNFFFG